MKTLRQYIIEARKAVPLDPETQKLVDVFEDLQKLDSDDFEVSYYVGKKPGKPSGCNISMFYDLKDDYINISTSIRYEKDTLMVSTPYISIYGGNNHSVINGTKYSADFDKIVPNWKPNGFRSMPAKGSYKKVDMDDIDLIKDCIIKSKDEIKNIANIINSGLIKDYDDLCAEAEENAASRLAGCNSVEDFRKDYADSGVGRSLFQDALTVIVSEYLRKDGKFVNAIKRFF